jgi:hypothetical protein
MERGRLLLQSRGEPIVIAYRESLLADERKKVLPETQARAELGWLAPDAVERLVDAFQERFPNCGDPEKTERVMAYVRDRVAAGAIAVVRR